MVVVDDNLLDLCIMSNGRGAEAKERPALAKLLRQWSDSNPHVVVGGTQSTSICKLLGDRYEPCCAAHSFVPFIVVGTNVHFYCSYSFEKFL